MENYYEQLLQRSNAVVHLINDRLLKLDPAMISWKEHSKTWSIIEVVDHLNKVYDIYLDNFEKAIHAAPQLDRQTHRLQHTLLGRLSIYSMKPKGQKRRFKMKTFNFFEPGQHLISNQTFDTFLANKEKFNQLMRTARLRNLENVKIPTALGEKMKFYVPECFDFLMSHEERHVVQIHGILEKADARISVD